MLSKSTFERFKSLSPQLCFIGTLFNLSTKWYIHVNKVGKYSKTKVHFVLLHLRKVIKLTYNFRFIS